jgi:hypothetical protein
MKTIKNYISLLKYGCFNPRLILATFIKFYATCLLILLFSALAYFLVNSFVKFASQLLLILFNI